MKWTTQDHPDLHVRTGTPKHAQETPLSAAALASSPRKTPKHLSAPAANVPLWRKRWFWGVLAAVFVVVVVVVSVAAAFTVGSLSALRSPTPTSIEYDLFQSGPRPPLRVQGSQLVRADGSEQAIHGVNWFGFNNGKTMVDGLDGEPTASWEGGDFATIVHQLKLLGFNAFRLPFQFSDLFVAKPQSFEKPCPSVQPTAASLGTRTTAPGDSSNGQAPPALPPLPLGSKPGVCNAYVPSTSTLERFVWTVKYLVEQGFYVLVDYHTHDKEGALESPAALTQNWMRVWRALTALNSWEEELKGRVFLDVINEPDEHKLGWDAPLPGSTKTASLSEYYFAVMDAIHQETPGSTLFFLQGGGQTALGTSWGDGYSTNATLIEQRGLSDPSAFFQTLATKPYRNQVVLAPHLYGVSVTRSPDVGAAQWEKFETSWGVLMSQGYCLPSNPSSCQRFPVVAGEIGTNFQNPLDLQYYNDMAAFFKRQPPTDKYKSAAFSNWFWWAYNANSGDTGGLVESDWSTLEWAKLNWLQQNVGLKPWYKA